MFTLEETGELLDELYDSVPSYAFKELSLGILLSEEVMLHKESVPEKPLYILGQYRRSNLGRQIVIYYGSFIRVHGNLPIQAFREKLKETLYHEITHHMEDLGGEWDLEWEDFINMEKYRGNL